MRTIEALKDLAGAIKGSGQASDIPGNTIPEVIEQIKEAYLASKEQEAGDS